ncbi:bifunctional cytidylyltransferase/SDR family oxidoreductase [Arthrobacter zhaoguopingii]|uniref:bifunctional cytidylyltransferase/SDR family oxidoreductase n=1 Tax=Arthrobacter zhaoguopingii TaxID=2681491 RepID=UPI00135A4B0D|nr:bifunctional cytidylyltransferase/SDR family oxidoreductase [Arthrobacter zhaoguopingii]
MAHSKDSKQLPGGGSAPGGRTIAVILAGGVGTRMGLDIPKQLVPIAGRTSLEHTVEIFSTCPGIDEILVMMDPGSMARARELLPASRFPRLSSILEGGLDRNDTSFRALQAIAEPGAKVIFHDAVRPLVDSSIIRACIEALDTYEAVDTGIPSADTIIEVDESNIIRAVPPRSSLRRGQTPQAFRWDTILDAYTRARQDPDFTATDDCSVVLKYRPDVPIIVVPGHEANIKITHPIDIHLADKLFQLKNQTAEPVPFPVSSLRGATVVIFGGSSGIGEELARQLDAEGANVVCHSRTGSGTFVEDRTSVARALAGVSATYGRIDHVVLTAGVLTIGALAELSDEQIRHDVDVNLMAAFVVAQESYSYLSGSQGSLLLYSSSSYTRGRAKYTVYSATKAAVVNLTQALADEWGEDRVRVNCISPSRTATPMRVKAFGVEDEHSLVQAGEVARVSAQVLASDLTGQVFDVRLPATDPLHVPLETAK